MENFKSTAVRAVIVLILGALLVCLGLMYVQRTSIERLESAAAAQKTALDVAQKKLADEQKASESLKTRLAAFNQQGQATDAQYKANIDAFARQAASCEAVKIKLGYSDAGT